MFKLSRASFLNAYLIYLLKSKDIDNLITYHEKKATEDAIEKREKMDDPSSNKNLYLMYRSKRLENISFFQSQANPQNEKPKGLFRIENQFNHK